MEHKNSVKAGQAVPVKWRLTDANGVAIDNPASIRVLASPLSTAPTSLATVNAVPEIAASTGGLQYKGDGNWQFNWKTPKDYANTCRVLVVQFFDPSAAGSSNDTCGLIDRQVHVLQVACLLWKSLNAAGRRSGAPRCTLKKPVPAVPRPISSSVASRTYFTFMSSRIAMPASGWLPSSTTCSG